MKQCLCKQRAATNLPSEKFIFALPDMPPPAAQIIRIPVSAVSRQAPGKGCAVLYEQVWHHIKEIITQRGRDCEFFEGRATKI